MGRLVFRARKSAIAALASALLVASVITLAQGAGASSHILVYSLIREVGRPVTFRSNRSADPSTALPKGVRKGNVVISYVDTDGSASVQCLRHWKRLFDTSDGPTTRLVACAGWDRGDLRDPMLLVRPASQVAMITMAFSGVSWNFYPVPASAAAPGTVSPSVPQSTGHVSLLFSEGINLHLVTRATAAKKVRGAHVLGVAKNPPRSEVIVATKLVQDPGTTPAWSWPAWTARGSDVSSTVALRPARRWLHHYGPASTSTTDPPTTTTSPAPAGTSTSTTTTTFTSTSTTTTTSSSTTTTSPPAGGGGAPGSPPAQVCGSSSLDGPATAPSGAVTVPAGNDSGDSFSTPGTTYWFAPGTHTLGTGAYSQIIPADNDTYIGAPGAVISGQGDNDFAFDQTATGVTIEYLTIKDFTPPGNEGAVNSSAAPNWTIQYDTVEDISPGTALYLGTNDVVNHNCLTENGQSAFGTYTVTDTNSLTDGASNITLSDNEISYNDTCNWEDISPDPVPAGDVPANCSGAGESTGCGCSGGGKFWEVDGATISGNYVHDNYNVGLWADDNNTGLTFTGNYISGNWGEGIIYELGYNAVIDGNTFVDNAWGKGPTNPGFPASAIYVSESGGDSRVPGANSGLFQIEDNTFTDNWAGVVLWEDSDRFCGDGLGINPTGACTLVDPSVANLTTCDAAHLTGATPSQTPDYYDLCRWKTQNVTVSDNTFNVTQADVPGCKGSANGCGMNGIFSEYGSAPSWSPYLGDVIDVAITKDQNNLFSDNTYSGPWSFMYHDQSGLLTMAEWQADGQDVSSVGS
ncbi:MAG: right-handed parallel beta-helix repeat-containing protein [Acidimicrobiales bacterium]